MAIARRIAYNVAVSSFSKIVSTVLALIAIGFITRYLGKEGFGNYATVLAFLSLFSALGDLGLYSIATREISREGANEKKIMGNIYALRMAVSSLVFLLSPIIVYFFNYPYEVKQGIFIMAGAFLFSSSYQVLNGIFQKNLSMDKVAMAELMGKIIQVSIVILAVKINLGFIGITASLLASMLVVWTFVYFWAKKIVNFSLDFDFPYWREFLKESMPMGVAAIIAFVYFKMDTILLSVMKSGAEVGIYNAAYKVLENITFFPAMIAGLVMPIMAKSVFSDKESFVRISNNTFKVFVILITPLIIGTMFLSENIINLIGGVDFLAAADVLRILIFALALIFFGQLFNSILVVANLQKSLMFILAGAAVVNVSLNLLLIPRFSYLASAYISVLTELIVVLLGCVVVYKKVGYVPTLQKAPQIILAGFIMAIFLNFSPLDNFFFLLICSSAVYFFSLWIFKAIGTDEISAIVTKKGIKEYEEIP